MFTGIIEEVGQILKIEKNQKSARLSISAKTILEDIHLGDSIAVNGICLTASFIADTYFRADVMAETMNRSNLGALQKGSFVNLERAMKADGRFGGHIVSGHVDGTGVISSFVKEENAVWVTIQANEGLLKYIVEKGSVAIDGISLTVAFVDEQCFQVSIIPHTASETILLKKNVGDKVNLECDVIGKYVEKLLFVQKQQPAKKDITLEFLQSHGF
mgnify:CR=1 FL=1